MRTPTLLFLILVSVSGTTLSAWAQSPVSSKPVILIIGENHKDPKRAEKDRALVVEQTKADARWTLALEGLSATEDFGHQSEDGQKWALFYGFANATRVIGLENDGLFSLSEIENQFRIYKLTLAAGAQLESTQEGRKSLEHWREYSGQLVEMLAAKEMLFHLLQISGARLQTDSWKEEKTQFAFIQQQITHEALKISNIRDSDLGESFLAAVKESASSEASHIQFRERYILHARTRAMAAAVTRVCKGSPDEQSSIAIIVGNQHVKELAELLTTECGRAYEVKSIDLT